MKLKKAAAILGRKGGKAGRGKSQVRGDSAYYRKLAKLGAEKRKARDLK